MEKGRDFVKYEVFNNKMLEVYDEIEEEKDIEYLYNEILEENKNDRIRIVN